MQQQIINVPCLYSLAASDSHNTKRYDQGPLGLYIFSSEGPQSTAFSRATPNCVLGKEMINKMLVEVTFLFGVSSGRKL